MSAKKNDGLDKLISKLRLDSKFAHRYDNHHRRAGKKRPKKK